MSAVLEPPQSLEADAELIEDAAGDLAGWKDAEEHLAEALKKDALQLYCQPIRNLRSGRYEMAEVLVRLREEENALLPPGDFLPVFEHYGMMPELDRWVVTHALSQLTRGLRVRRLSINLSGQTFGDTEFPNFVAAELQKAGLSNDSLLFELDESDTLDRPAAAEAIAEQLRNVGCGITMDSFGRRSVSFDQLRTLKPKFVKIDGTVTRKILKDPKAEKKLRAIIRVGELLKFESIAECVEDQDVLLRLRALGIGQAQGFGITRPQPLENLA